MNATYKQYNFVCVGCQESFKKGMWYDKAGEPEGCKCPKCDAINTEPFYDNEIPSSAMVNFRGSNDWTKKIPGDFKDFMSTFAKRHSKYGRTVNDHKNGRSEI